MKHARTILVDPVQLPLLLCCSTSLQEKAAASGAAREAAQAAEEVRQILHWHIALAWLADLWYNIIYIINCICIYIYMYNY